MFLYKNGTVKQNYKISNTTGGFDARITNNDYFGRSIALLGDLNNDKRPDLAVGAPFDDDDGTDKGAMHILFLDTDKAPLVVDTDTGNVRVEILEVVSLIVARGINITGVKPDPDDALSYGTVDTLTGLVDNLTSGTIQQTNISVINDGSAVNINVTANTSTQAETDFAFIGGDAATADATFYIRDDPVNNTAGACDGIVTTTTGYDLIEIDPAPPERVCENLSVGDGFNVFGRFDLPDNVTSGNKTITLVFYASKAQ